jgi:predicted GIY-YIG superfamily endonuclease
MAFWAYMLRCADGRYYTGHTDNLERRIGEHQSGVCAYTSRRLPVELVWSETFVSRIEAMETERMVGGWSRAKKEALIAGDWERVSFFARPPKRRFSTSLETNGDTVSTAPSPFVSSEVEKPAPPNTKSPTPSR